MSALAQVGPARAQDAETTPAEAAPEAMFTVAVSSAYTRAEPRLEAEWVFSVFEGELYPVLGASADEGWVLLGNWLGDSGWIPASYGLAGDQRLEVAQRPKTAVPRLPEGVIGGLSAKALEIYQRGLRLGNDPHAFAKVGDCNSENGRFLVYFDQLGAYRLGDQFDTLQATVDYFAGSFARTSVAARSGFSPAAVLDPLWADPALCQAGESPLACEYRLTRASFALIALGTHTGRSVAQFEADLRLVIETTVNKGIVPILMTKADNVEGGDRVNAAIRRLAEEYDVPLWDFWLAAQRLPGGGLSSDGVHLTYSRPVFDDVWSVLHGWPMRNLTALMQLEAVRQAVERPGSSVKGR